MGAPPADTVRDALVRAVLAAARQRAAWARQLSLTETDVRALQHLAVAEPLTASRLGALLDLSSGGATALVQRLQRAGWITRQPNPQDRRSAWLRLAPTVEARRAELLAQFDAGVEAVVDDLSERDLTIVGDALQRLAEAAERRADELARQATAAVADAKSSPVPGLWA